MLLNAAGDARIPALPCEPVTSWILEPFRIGSSGLVHIIEIPGHSNFALLTTHPTSEP